MKVSWEQYFLFTTCITVAYYAAIAILYYRQDILFFLSSKKMAPQFVQSNNTNPIVNEINSEDNQGLMPYVHELVKELQQTFATASRKRLIKEELIMSLQLHLKKYPMLKDTLFVQSINKFIDSEAEVACSIHLNEQELRTLWLAIE